MHIRREDSTRSDLPAYGKQTSAAPRGYNERLFSGGLRSRLHHARFLWLQCELRKLNPEPVSAFELGCFDGKTIRYLPDACTTYVGCDANWEGGLDMAQQLWRNHNRCEFLFCRSPNDLRMLRDRCFDVSICMETLEHLDNDLADSYLAFMRDITKSHIFITVPNEKGPVFLAKHLAKTLSSSFQSKETQSFTLTEIMWLTLGACSRVDREEHKGFDYASMLTLINKYFDIVQTRGIPSKILPLYLSFTIGIVGRARRQAPGSERLQ